jgi:hypothetical protein
VDTLKTEIMNVLSGIILFTFLSSFSFAQQTGEKIFIPSSEKTVTLYDYAPAAVQQNAVKMNSGRISSYKTAAMPVARNTENFRSNMPVAAQDPDIKCSGRVIMVE